METAFLSLVAGGVALMSLRKATIAILLQEVQVSDHEKNDDRIAKTTFLDLLNEGKEEMLLHDDGGPGTPASIYESEEVVDAIDTKLNATPAFEIKCLFSDRATTLFKQRLEEHPRVQISYRPRSAVHYKIIDRRKAYVSCHRVNSPARNYKRIECPTGRLARLFASSISEAALGPYLRDFEAHAA